MPFRPRRRDRYRRPVRTRQETVLALVISALLGGCRAQTPPAEAPVAGPTRPPTPKPFSLPAACFRVVETSSAGARVLLTATTAPAALEFVTPLGLKTGALQGAIEERSPCGTGDRLRYARYGGAEIIGAVMAFLPGSPAVQLVDGASATSTAGRPRELTACSERHHGKLSVSGCPGDEEVMLHGGQRLPRGSGPAFVAFANVGGFPAWIQNFCLDGSGCSLELHVDTGTVVRVASCADDYRECSTPE